MENNVDVNQLREEDLNLNESDDSDNEGNYQPHTNFYNLYVYVECLSKEEEEELQASRKKVREFNRRTRSQRSQDNQDADGNAADAET